MIQRVQSLFLLGVSICMLLVLFFPIWEKTAADTQEWAVLDAYTLVHTRVDALDNGQQEEVVVNERPTFFIAILAVIAAGVAFYEIFQYKNRLTQIKLGALNSLLMAGTLGVALYFTYQGEQFFEPQLKGSYRAGMFMPMIALVLNLLANRFIRRDEMLVRSVDRIR
jgi:hypothetical protein